MTDKARRAKVYLEKISDLKRLSAVSHMLAVELRESGITKPTEYGMRIQKSGGYDMADRVAQIQEKEQTAIEKSLEYAKKVEELTKLILSMSDTRHAEILFRKFVKGESMESIATAMNYSAQRVFQLYPQALESFAELLPDPFFTEKCG